MCVCVWYMYMCMNTCMCTYAFVQRVHVCVHGVCMCVYMCSVYACVQCKGKSGNEKDLTSVMCCGSGSCGRMEDGKYRRVGGCAGAGSAPQRGR